jgi:hypothetical protein
MKDFYGREIQIGDKCVFSDEHGRFDSRPIYELHSDDNCPEDDYVEIADYYETLTKKAKEIIDITAIEREARNQQFLNFVKVLNVKPNDVVIASLIPNQLNMVENQRIFEQLKKLFPNNEVGLMIGLDVSVKDGSEINV